MGVQSLLFSVQTPLPTFDAFSIIFDFNTIIFGALFIIFGAFSMIGLLLVYTVYIRYVCRHDRHQFPM